MPLWPVNQCTPFRSKVAVLRLVYPLPSGSGQAFTWRVFGSTRTIAFWPPSVSHGAPSSPAITPCGEEPGPSATNSTLPDFGSRMPRWPLPWAENHTGPPGAASAQTSCTWWPRGIGYSWTLTCAPADAVKSHSRRILFMSAARQALGDAVDPGLRAYRVLVAARGARDADRAH